MLGAAQYGQHTIPICKFLQGILYAGDEKLLKRGFVQ